MIATFRKVSLNLQHDYWQKTKILRFLLISLGRTTTFLFGILAFLTKTWIEKRIELSIQYEYERKLSKFENDLEVRLRAELVADLMAEWTHKSGIRLLPRWVS